jgi:hypothetical protein
MSRDTIINSILTVVGVVILALAVLQTGWLGEGLRVSSWFGIGASSIATQDDYTICKQNSGDIVLAVPRSCQKDGKTYYESYNKTDEATYRLTVENEAAQLGKVIVAPLNQQGLNRAVLEQPATDTVVYGAIYTAKQDSQMVKARIANKNLKGLQTADNELWNKLLNAQKAEDVQSSLGGNTAIVSTIDLSSRGYSKAVVIVDGEADRVLAPYSVLVVGQVRDNYVLLSGDLVIDTLANSIADCVKSPTVTNAQDKDLESQKCLNTKISTDTALASAITAKAQKLAEVFAF